eukprot:COSAG02_NODE_3416_length_6780_cov_67.531208_1_plen_84_part_00
MVGVVHRGLGWEGIQERREGWGGDRVGLVCLPWGLQGEGGADGALTGRSRSRSVGRTVFDGSAACAHRRLARPACVAVGASTA